MREETLRSVLLVKAIEAVDAGGAVIPASDRAHATRDTMRVLGIPAQPSGGGTGDALLAQALGKRAELLAGPLVEQFPVLPEVLGRTRTPSWLLVVLLLLAFAAGVSLSALDGSRHIDILALPFLGVVAWNLATYVALAIGWLRRHRGADRPAPARDRWAGLAFARRIGTLVKRTARVHAVLARAISAYVVSWLDVGRPFIAQHARRWLHLGAAAVALGLIAGLYLRGTVLRYEAGWDSTFLGPAQVQAVMGVLFGPVAGWSGVALPATPDAVERLRWTTAGGGGEAAPWIHLIALSLMCYVVLPRLLLAAAATLSLAYLGRPGALPDALRPYAAEVLDGGAIARSGGITSVTPYAYEPADASLAGLERWLESNTRGDVRIDRRTTLRYGEEDMAGPAFDFGAHRVADQHVVLMNLAATPEAENHGVVIAAARDSARRARPPATVRVVVDETPYADRLARDAALESRLEERRRLWREFVRGYGLDAEVIELARAGGAGEPREAGRA